MIEGYALTKGYIDKCESFELTLKSGLQITRVGHMTSQKVELFFSEGGIPRQLRISDDPVLGGFAVDIAQLHFEKCHSCVVIVADSNFETDVPATGVIFEALAVFGVVVKVFVGCRDVVLNGQNAMVRQGSHQMNQPSLWYQVFGIEPVHERHRFDGVKAYRGSAPERFEQVHGGQKWIHKVQRPKQWGAKVQRDGRLNGCVDSPLTPPAKSL